MSVCRIRKVHAEKVEKAIRDMAGDQIIQLMADVFKALGDPSRLKMVMALAVSELCVCDISAVCGLTESAVSHQLRILRNLRIVRYRREGKMVFYQLADDHVQTLVQQTCQHIMEPGEVGSAAIPGRST